MLVTMEPQRKILDYVALKNTKDRVQRWSIIVCSVQIAVAMFYVYFIRRLFLVNEKKFNQARA